MKLDEKQLYHSLCLPTSLFFRDFPIVENLYISISYRKKCLFCLFLLKGSQIEARKSVLENRLSEELRRGWRGGVM